MLYEAGAKQVHVRIACPEIRFPDFYGVDMSQKVNYLHTKKVMLKCVNILKQKT